MTAVTALYPVITVTLAVAWPIIGEPFTARTALGVALAILAGLALAL